MFSIIVAGGREFDNYGLLSRKLDFFLSRKPAGEVRIISGDARGADRLGHRYADEHGIACLVMPADWETHGKKAGYIRNDRMAKEADALVAFWDGQSKGTAHMIKTMESMGKPVRVVRYDPVTKQFVPKSAEEEAENHAN